MVAWLAAAGAAASILVPWGARAHSGDFFEAFLLNPVTIDGVLSPGEWTDASTNSFTVCAGVNAGQMYVKNDATHLYIAVLVENVRWNFLGGSGNDFLNVIFDTNHSGTTQIGDNYWAVRGGDSLFVDAFNPTGLLYHSSDDTYAGGTTDMVGAATHTNPVEHGVGTYTVEYQGLLDSADDAHDFSLAPGDTVGVAFLLADASSSCANRMWPSPLASQFADIVIASVPDSDLDGVLDEVDACPNTAAGDPVNASGCSIANLCPCTASWKNHGAYVSCVAQASSAFQAAGLITSARKDAITQQAAQSGCGK